MSIKTLIFSSLRILMGDLAMRNHWIFAILVCGQFTNVSRQGAATIEKSIPGVYVAHGPWGIPIDEHNRKYGSHSSSFKRKREQ